MSILAKSKGKKAIALLLAAIMMWTAFPITARAEHRDVTLPLLEQMMEDIIEWKKADTGTDGGDLFGQNLLSNSQNLDWYAVGIGRMGYEDDYSAYLSILKNTVTQKYTQPDQLDLQKATEWHRIALAILSLGGDPTQAGTDPDGEKINLIADGVYYRGRTQSLGSQGINGYIWGLIALDAMRYQVPEDATDTRDTILLKILENQGSEGAFSLDGKSADLDVTAMALTALAPYYNSEEEYLVHGEYKTVRDSADRAVVYLSEQQEKDVTFVSWGKGSCEISSQVMIALCSLGIDPVNDPRFIKDGNNVLDGLIKYRISDGGFTHSFEQDEENPSAKAGESNAMASEQALCALVSLYRFQTGLRAFYDFRPEMSQEQREQMMDLESQIDAMEKDADSVQSLFECYLSIPVQERCYVTNYKKLADAMEAFQQTNTSEFLAGVMNENSSGNGTVTDIIHQTTVTQNLVFQEEDRQAYQELPEIMTTEYKTQVIRLLDKLESSKNKEEYPDILSGLEQKKAQIGEIEKKIEQINTEILDSLYPFENIGYGDKGTIDSILSQINQLSEYDRNQVLGYQDVLRAKAQLDTQVRSVILTVCIGIGIAILVVVFYIRFRKKRKEPEDSFLIEEDNDDW